VIGNCLCSKGIKCVVTRTFGSAGLVAAGMLVIVIGIRA